MGSEDKNLTKGRCRACLQNTLNIFLYNFGKKVLVTQFDRTELPENIQSFQNRNKSNLKISSLVLYEISLFFIDLRSVEIFDIG